MPILNLPAMGMPPSRFVQLPAHTNFPPGQGLDHSFAWALIKALTSCLAADSVVGQREWWAHDVGNRVVCFERMVVPLIRCGGKAFFVQRPRSLTESGEVGASTFPMHGPDLFRRGTPLYPL